MAKPGVLIVCPFYPPNLGGVETHLQMLTDYLGDEGYPTNVLTYRPLATRGVPYEHYEEQGPVHIRRFRWFGVGWFDKLTPYPMLQFLYVVPGLLMAALGWMVCHGGEVQVIHAHGFAGGFVARVLGLFFRDRRLVVSTHFIYRKLLPGSLRARLFAWVFAGFDEILLVGEESGRELQALGLPAGKMHTFHHWLNDEQFAEQDKGACRKRLGLPAEARFIVLFVGRILRMKGVFVLLEVARTLPPAVHVVLVGDGPAAEALRREARGVPNFMMTGRKEHAGIVEYLGACDLLILPSQAEEAQPMVVMEALMCGRPVVVTDKGAVREMINDSVGLSLEPIAETIRKTVMDLYENPEKVDAMTRAARPFALAQYGRRNAERIVATYDVSARKQED